MTDMEDSSFLVSMCGRVDRHIRRKVEGLYQLRKGKNVEEMIVTSDSVVVKNRFDDRIEESTKGLKVITEEC